MKVQGFSEHHVTYSNLKRAGIADYLLHKYPRLGSSCHLPLILEISSVSRLLFTWVAAVPSSLTWVAAVPPPYLGSSCPSSLPG
jgi:hypothetical protein